MTSKKPSGGFLPNKMKCADLRDMRRNADITFVHKPRFDDSFIQTCLYESNSETITYEKTLQIGNQPNY